MQLLALVGRQRREQFLLAKIGGRLDRPHVRNEDNASRSWTAWARIVVRGRWAAAGGALVVLAVLVIAGIHGAVVLGGAQWSRSGTVLVDGIARGPA